jgi:hypothetical protein
MTAVSDRRDLAAFLFRHGPTHGRALRVALGWTVSRFWDAVYGGSGDQFTITSDGWGLAEAASAEWVETDGMVLVAVA